MRFVHDGQSPRVVFGAGSVKELPSEIDRLGVSRALIVATPGRGELVGRIESLIGHRAGGKFLGAQVHVPADVATEAESLAKRVRADSIISVGGGSAIGAAKAVALDTTFPIIAIATTYSGSEMTPIWGLSNHSGKRTGRDSRVMPRVVIYDPELTLDLPVAVSVASGFNALAHCMESLYASNATPLTSMTAVLGFEIVPSALRRIVADPRSTDAREDALYGAMLAGQALAATQMGIHHKVCHVLAGSFGLPHADAHAVLLPHSAAFNRDAAPAEMDVIAAAVGADDAPGGLFDLGVELGAPRSLAALGMREADLDRAAELVVEKPYANPRTVTREGVRAMLENAFRGERP